LRAMQSLVERTWDESSHLHVGDLAWQWALAGELTDWPAALWENGGEVQAFGWLQDGPLPRRRSAQARAGQRRRQLGSRRHTRAGADHGGARRTPRCWRRCAGPASRRRTAGRSRSTWGVSSGPWRDTPAAGAAAFRAQQGTTYRAETADRGRSGP